MITVFKTSQNEIYVRGNSNKLNQTLINEIFLHVSRNKSENNSFQVHVTGYDKLSIQSGKKENIGPNSDDILCNPLYDLDPNGMTVLITTLEKNYFKSVTDYKPSKYSKIISFNNNLHSRYSYSSNKNNFFYKIPRNILIEIASKRNFFNLVKKFNMTQHHPKTFYDNELPEDANEKNYFLKYAEANAQRGVYFGKKEFLDKILRRWSSKSVYIYQEPIYNCLKYNEDRRIVFGMWFLLFNNSFTIYKKTTEISVDTLKKNGKMSLCYNLLKDEDIPNHTIILNNMINICEKFLTNFQNHLKECDYTIQSNEFGLCRMDFLIEEKTYKPYMLEINTGIDLDGKQSHKDNVFCEFLVKEKIINLLYKNDGYL